ncbi:MAG: TVP38/TMEM64 family protein [Verrucomicrobiota bacterium]
MNRSTITKLIAGILFVGLLVFLFQALPIGEMLRSATSWVESLGIWAPLAFIAIYALAVVFFIPASLLTAAAGTVFGVAYGSIYVSIASTLGATLAFLVGRFLARDWVAKKISGNRTFSALDTAVESEGWKIVGLTRLSPVFPFTLLNYAYGVTKVKLSHYVPASWIGMMPGTVLYVYVGSLGKAASEAEGKSPAEWVMYGIGLIATLIVTIYVTKIARAALNSRIEN